MTEEEATEYVEVTVGRFYGEADDTRTTNVNYHGTNYLIRECYWENSDTFGVTMSMNGVDAARDWEDLHDKLIDYIEGVEVLRGLGYDLQRVDGHTVCWVKSA